MQNEVVLPSDNEELQEYNNKHSDKNKNFSMDMPEIYQAAVSSQHHHSKKLTCPFCHCRTTNFVPHLISRHSDQDEVIDIMSFGPGSKERAQKINLLRYRGNHATNILTLKKQKGLFIPEKRTTGKWRVGDYQPCPLCHKWLTTNTFYRHRKYCVKNDESVPHCELIIQSEILAGKISPEASNELRKEVLSNMHSDDIGKIAKQDRLIAMIGNSAYKRCIGNPVMRKYNVSSVMRLVARLLKELRLLAQDMSLTLFQAIHPNMYDNFIKAVFAVCGEEQIEEAAAPVSDCDLLKAPSNALKLSYDITKLCNMKMALAIHDEDRVAGEKDRKDSKRFMDLYRSQWEVDVKKKARHVLRERKLNMTVHLPDPADIAKLASHLRAKMLAMEMPASYDDFRRMQYLCLARLMSYNRRGPGEVQTLK